MKSEDREDIVRFLTRCLLAFGPGFAVGSVSALYESYHVGSSGGAATSLFAPLESAWSWIIAITVLSIPMGWIDSMFNRNVRRFDGELNRGEMLESIAWFCVRQVPIAPLAAFLSWILTWIAIQLAL